MHVTVIPLCDTARVKNKCSSYKAVNFYFIVGEAGKPGSAPGFPGQKGDRGAVGRTGAQGTKGERGQTGKSGVKYVRWGRITCPSGTEIVYKGA